MYGYVKQPDGVLKPILLKGIKNIIVSGDSLNIIYFQSNSSTINVIKSDQEIYRTEGRLVVCDQTAVNGDYTLTGGNLVSGDIKLNFSSPNLNILDVFTNWMNSILSGKVNNTNKTLNEFAPQLDIGYVFGNVGTIPTALAMPIAQGQDACSTNLVVADSKIVYVAWDLQVDALPPVHTQLFEILFNNTDGTASFTPLNSGEYVLYQFIAPVKGESDCDYTNVLALSIPENITYPVNVSAGGITSITTCEASIDATFKTYDNANNSQVKTTIYSKNGCDTGNCPPVEGNPGDEVNAWDYYFRQSNTSAFSTNDVSGTGWQPNQPFEVRCGGQVISSEIASGEQALNADWRINPTFGGPNAYPSKFVDAGEFQDIFPEFGLQGVAMNVVKTTAGQIDPNGFGLIDIPEIHVCNGIPVTLDNKWRLDPTMISKNKSLLYTEGSQGSGNPAPPFWNNGIPLVNNPAFNSPNYMWVTDKGINIRPVNRIGGKPSDEYSWNSIWNNEITVAMKAAGLIKNTPAASPGVSDFPSELESKLRLWWRNYIPSKSIYDPAGYTVFNPAYQSETGLPSLMTKNSFQAGPGSNFITTYPTNGGIVPFIVEETYQPFLDAGFTHRAFLVGSVGSYTLDFEMGGYTFDFDNKFSAGAVLNQRLAVGGNSAVINEWTATPNIKTIASCDFS